MSGGESKTKNKRNIRAEKVVDCSSSIQMPVLSFVSFGICLVLSFAWMWMWMCVPAIVCPVRTLFRAAILLVTQVDTRKSHWSLSS